MDQHIAKKMTSESMYRLIEIAKHFAESCAENRLLLGFTGFRSVAVPGGFLVDMYSSPDAQVPVPSALTNWVERSGEFPTVAVALVSMAAVMDGAESQQGIVISARTFHGEHCSTLRNWVADGPVGDWIEDVGRSNFSDMCELVIDASGLNQMTIHARSKKPCFQPFGAGGES